jgi:hypothetical protein
MSDENGRAADEAAVGQVLIAVGASFRALDTGGLDRGACCGDGEVELLRPLTRATSQGQTPPACVDASPRRLRARRSFLG